MPESESGISRTTFWLPQLRTRPTVDYVGEVMREHFHAVRFYEDDQSLYRIASSFIGAGLVAGQPAVVIATPVHREEIARALEALSCDVNQLCATGQLLMLDAQETLLTFMKDGSPETAAFHASLGRTLNSVTAGRPPGTVRAYGEMVDCLWKDGHGAYEDICRQHTHVLSGAGHPTRIGVA